MKEIYLIPSGGKQVQLDFLFSVQCYRLVYRIRLSVPRKPPRKARVVTVFCTEINLAHCENQDTRDFGMGTSNFCMPSPQLS